MVADVSTFVDVYLFCCGFCIHGLSEILWYKMCLLSEEVDIGFVVVFCIHWLSKILWYKMFLPSVEVPIGFVACIFWHFVVLDVFNIQGDAYWLCCNFCILSGLLFSIFEKYLKRKQYSVFLNTRIYQS